MDKICEMKSLLEAQAMAQMGNLAQCDTKELGEVIDMIKDLTEAEYYCEAIKAMKGSGEELAEYDDRMGYNTSRYNSGRYAPKGSGHYSNTGNTMGYIPMIEQKPYIDEYVQDPVRFRERMGYHDEMNYPTHNRFGESYEEWKKARRNYTQTHNASDKAEMNTHTNEHLSDTMVTLKEMWTEADPNLKNEMKMKLQQLINDLK